MPAPFVLSSDLVSAYPAKSVDLADFINGYKLDTGPVQNAQTGTTYTFALSDTTKTVTANNAAASAYTVPPQSAVVWEAYTTLRILNLGAGVVTLTAGAGVTLTGTVTVAQYASATLTRTGSNAWTISGNASASGMDLITPTSVAGSGVTLSGGAVSFSASSTVSVNGCFTSTYENYRLIYTSSLSAGALLELSARLRLSGTDNSSNVYKYMYINIEPSLSAIRATNTSIIVGLVDTTSDANGGTIDILRPQIAKNTVFLTDTFGPYLSGFGRKTGGYFDGATQFDGITIFPASGTLTGTLRIYGLRNS